MNHLSHRDTGDETATAPERPTVEQLAEWRRLEQAATRGPWYTVDPIWLPRDVGTYVVAGHPDPHVGTPVLDHIEIEEWDADDDGPDYGQSWANLEFAAAARTAVPALLAEVERLAADRATAILRAGDAEARLAALEEQLSLRRMDVDRLRRELDALFDRLANAERDYAMRIVEAMGADPNDFDTDDWPDNVIPAVERLAGRLAALEPLARAAARYALPGEIDALVLSLPPDLRRALEAGDGG